MEPLDFCHSILHQLPVEVITMILTHLRLKDLFNVALACKDLRSLVFDNNALWRVKCGQMLTVTHAKTHNGLSNNYSLSAYDQCRISFNWQRGCFREMLIARSTVKYMPWICLQPDILILSTGFTLSCIAKDNRSLPSWKQALWTLNVPKVTRRGVRTNDISRFVIKDNVIVCGNRDGCIAVYGHKTGSRTVQDFVSSAPVLRHHIKDCHEDGAAEVSAVDCSGRHGDMCIASTSSDCRIIKFWKQSCANLDAKDPSGRRTNANRSKYNKKSRCIFTCVRGVETTGGTGGKCLLMDASESRLAVGLNGSRMPLLVDIETGSALSNPIPMQNNRECVKDITWLNENMVVYVTHTGYLYCLDTRTKQIVYQSFDPLAASLYSVKTDGQHAIITGSSQSSRCTLYDSRSSKCCVQILFTQKCSSPVYSVDFDASTLAAAAERGVAILNFNVNSANTSCRDYAAIVASFRNGNTAGLLL